jgi:hypothetical protein
MGCTTRTRIGQMPAPCESLENACAESADAGAAGSPQVNSPEAHRDAEGCAGHARYVTINPKKPLLRAAEPMTNSYAG